jgi:lipopolysaccharide/colanic/teichoic acid biosynthesis glycosyltransferase
MSFVGPRPAVVGELEEESGMPPNVADRFKVKPGLTGWAQIHGRDNLSWQQKIVYDLEYVSFSPVKRLLVDIYIIMYTPLYLLNFNATYEKRN